MRRLVLDHHERLDGCGYPRGIGSEELDLATRILTVCDVYEALVSRRAYRPAWSREEALALLNTESNVAFDPRCVAALERIVGAPVEREERAPVLIGAAPAPSAS